MLGERYEPSEADSTMARTAVTIGFSAPPELAREVERLAAAEGKSKSELFR